MQLRFDRPKATFGLIWIAICAAGPSLACNDVRFDGFLSQPIEVDTRGMIPVMEVGLGEQTTALGIVDSGSPLTVVARTGDGSHQQGQLRLRERISTDRVERVGKQVVTRFIVRNVDIYDLALSPVGLDSEPVEIGAIVGADLLSRVALTLVYEQQLERGSLTLRDEISGTGEELAEDCDLCQLLKSDGFSRQRCNAVTGIRRRGGGQALIGGNERTLVPTRLVVGVCALPTLFNPTEPDPTALEASGTPLTGLIATGMGVSIIARSAFERLRLENPDLSAESGHTLHLPYGAEAVELTHIPRIAVVSNRTDRFGPCGEIARRRQMLVGAFERDDAGRGGAAIALAGNDDNRIAFAVLADESELFQGLRRELRPETADIDLLLGGSFLRFFETSLDYPAERVVLRCTQKTAGAGCETIPHCNEGARPPCSNARGLSDQPCN
jgi:hypothetical protein